MLFVRRSRVLDAVFVSSAMLAPKRIRFARLQLKFSVANGDHGLTRCEYGDNDLAIDRLVRVRIDGSTGWHHRALDVAQLKTSKQ